MLNSDVLEQATLQAGAYPHWYGDRLGAQLDLMRREGSRAATQLRGAVSGTNATLVAEGPIGRSERGSWLFTLRQSYLEWPTKLLQDFSGRAFGFTDTQAKLAYDVRPSQQVSFSVLGGRSRMDERGEREPHELALGTNQAAVLNLGWRRMARTGSLPEKSNEMMTLRTFATVMLSFFAGSMASDLFHVTAQSPCLPMTEEAAPGSALLAKDVRWASGGSSPAGSPSPQPSPPEGEREPEAERSLFTLGTPRVTVGADIVVARVSDRALKAAMGREQQTKPAYAILAFSGDVTKRISYRVALNPADDAIVPRPYVPSPDDRRTYFFPNQPEGRGVVSDPSGLYKVDTYKHPGLDPVIQQGLLRVGYFDLHDSRRRYGLRVGRFYVPKGLGLHEATWFTAKDLTHIQAINLVADNGLSLSYDPGPYRLDLSAVAGNGNPYHDYGYFDFTEPTEDKNTDVAVVATGRVRTGRVELGASYQLNDLNSRIEDSPSVQLSKHNDDAVLVFGSARPSGSVRVFGEVARYTWGLTESSAELFAGPPIQTPVIKTGFYIGADLFGPVTRFGRWGLTVTTERLSRNDALVAWAASRGLFDVRLGDHERSTIVKVHGQFGRHLTSFVFLNFLHNPFPELSAIRPIAGYGSQHESSSFKFGYGMRLRMDREAHED